MPKTFNSIWVHLVFSTKHRIPYINWHIRGEVCEFIKQDAFKRGIQIDIVNGYQDHLHILLKLSTTRSISEVASLIKGASSKWLNDKYSWEGGFKWQSGYGAFSVSPKDIEKVRAYIFNQERHHKKKSYSKEIKEMVKES